MLKIILWILGQINTIIYSSNNPDKILLCKIDSFSKLFLHVILFTFKFSISLLLLFVLFHIVFWTFFHRLKSNLHRGEKFRHWYLDITKFFIICICQSAKQNIQWSLITFFLSMRRPYLIDLNYFSPFKKQKKQGPKLGEIALTRQGAAFNKKETRFSKA